MIGISYSLSDVVCTLLVSQTCSIGKICVNDARAPSGVSSIRKL